MNTIQTFRRLLGHPLARTLGIGSLVLAAPGLHAQDRDQTQREQARSEQQAQQQQGQQQAQQQGRQQNGTNVVVEEQPPQVQVQQADPRVTAEQRPMDVDVQTGEPNVSVQQPEPEVSVEQPEPQVSIQQAEPRVIVESAEPQVEVNQAEPEVTVNSAEPEVQVVRENQSGQRRSAQAQQAQQGGQAQQDQQQQAQQQGQQAQQTRDPMQAELATLQGASIVNSQGEEVGSVEDIVVNPQSGQAGFVTSTGGVLGLGGEDIFVPANEAEMRGDNQIVWQTSMSLQEIAQNAQFQPQQYTSVADAQGTLSQARDSATQRAQR